MNQHALQSSAALLSLLVSLVGCTEHVVGGVEPQSGSTEVGPTPTALAFLGSSMPADPDGFVQAATITLVPDTLYVVIGNSGQTCEDPWLPATVCTPSHAYVEWEVVLGIPAAQQAAGVLSFPATGVDDVVALNGATDSSGGPCSGVVAPNGLQGDVGITSIDATQVTLQFMGVAPQVQIESTPPSEMTATYTATRCP